MTNPVDSSQLSTDVILSTGTQTISGSKTFSIPPSSSSAPTIGAHLANKTYVDANAAPSSIGGDGSDGPFTNAGSIALSGTKNYTTFVNTGTITVPANHALVIK